MARGSNSRSNHSTTNSSVATSGEVVTREETPQPELAADTFVDFDNSPEHGVNKLRELLRSADNPVHRDTPRRGYRLSPLLPGRWQREGPPRV